MVWGWYDTPRCCEGALSILWSRWMRLTRLRQGPRLLLQDQPSRLLSREQQGGKRKKKEHPFSLRTFPHFHLYPLGQNLVTQPGRQGNVVFMLGSQVPNIKKQTNKQNRHYMSRAKEENGQTIAISVILFFCMPCQSACTIHLWSTT